MDNGREGGFQLMNNNNGNGEAVWTFDTVSLVAVVGEWGWREEREWW
jgi:hypothetical protein